MKTNMKISDFLPLTFGARDRNCPREVDVLAYTEGKLSTLGRVRIERHIAQCDDCRQVIAFIGRESLENSPPLTQTEVSVQTGRVLGYIRNSEINKTSSARHEGGFRISYAGLATAALVVIVIGIAAAILMARREGPAEGAMDALGLALKDQRLIEPRISGRLPYSSYSGVTRGENANDDNLHFERALNKLSAAEQANAPAEQRLTLARVYLARGTPSDIDRALKILNQLSADGFETAEVLNDTGVAHMQRYDNDKAIELFTRSLAKTPNYDQALFNKALAEQRLRHNDDAKRDWRQFIAQTTDEKWKAEAADHVQALSRVDR